MTDIHANNSADDMSRQCMCDCSNRTEKESERDNYQDKQ